MLFFPPLQLGASLELYKNSKAVGVDKMSKFSKDEKQHQCLKSYPDPIFLMANLPVSITSTEKKSL